MIKIEHIDISGWEACVRGMRNSWDSWDKSDSVFWSEPHCHNINNQASDWIKYSDEIKRVGCKLGPNDLKLMQTLSSTGRGSERKYLRYIIVTSDITAPLYFWKEWDQSKVGTVTNSTSTMHSIAAKPFELDNFSHEHLSKASLTYLNSLIEHLNFVRDIYNKDKTNKGAWWQMIQLLPSSYNQKRTVLLNYEVLAAQYKDRRNHKLDDWQQYCDWIESLPYSELITNPNWREKRDKKENEDK